jgi:hypothetical protein
MTGCNLSVRWRRARLERLKLGTSYPTIVARVRELCRREPLLSHRPRLAVDQTGGGAPVVDLFKQTELNADLRPILIHGPCSKRGRCLACAKTRTRRRNSISAPTGRLKIASELPEVSVLTAELQNFEVSISESGFDSYEARTGKHDDLVLSQAMALWLGQKTKQWVMMVGECQ